MASGWHLIALVALVLIPGLAGCSSSPPTAGESALETQSDDQRKANRIARDYLKHHGGVARNDVFIASPYENGWLVRVERMTGTGPYGDVIDPGQTRFVKIGPNWRVLEGISGAGID